MNKNRRSLAFLLTLALIFAFPAFAFAEPITGDSTVIDVPLNVILPTNLDFALDPLGIDSVDNQISSPDFIIANQTLAPVKIEVDITANVSGGATLVDDPTVLARDDDDVTDKNIYFAAMGATDITPNSIYSIAEDVVAPTAIATAPGIYDYTETATRAVFDPVGDGKASGSALIGFILDKAVASATEGAIKSMAASDKGVAMFRFYGELNTYADWQNGDIDVAATINLIPLRTSTYGNLTDPTEGILIDEGVNQIELVEPEPEDPTYDSAGFIVGENTSTTRSAVTISKASADSYNIPFYFDEKTIQSLVMNGTLTIPVSDYTISGNNLVMVKDGGTTHMFDKAAVGAKTMVLTLTGDATSYSFTINLVD